MSMNFHSKLTLLFNSNIMHYRRYKHTDPYLILLSWLQMPVNSHWTPTQQVWMSFWQKRTKRQHMSERINLILIILKDLTAVKYCVKRVWLVGITGRLRMFSLMELEWHTKVSIGWETAQVNFLWEGMKSLGVGVLMGAFIITGLVWRSLARPEKVSLECIWTGQQVFCPFLRSFLIHWSTCTPPVQLSPNHYILVSMSVMDQLESAK